MHATNPGFPTGAIYVSESGGSPAVANPAHIDTITISGNAFTDNWSGVVLWENSNRFCGSPDNTSTGDCTLVDPSQANVSSCDRSGLKDAVASGQPPLFIDCRWKTRDVSVTGNSFTTDAASIPHCDGRSNSCGENGIFSEYCSNSDNGIGWSPYCPSSDGNLIPNDISRWQANSFAGNTYDGSWSFMIHDLGTVVSFATWQKTWAQDARSNLR